MIDIKFTIPYDPELSKNNRYINIKSRAGKKLIKNRKHLDIQNNITMIFKSHLWKFPSVLKCKFYVCIKLFRPNKRTDSSNYINPIVDALKLCLPMDDTMCAGSWDFEEDKINPRIEIQVLIPEHEIV